MKKIEELFYSKRLSFHVYLHVYIKCLTKSIVNPISTIMTFCYNLWKIHVAVGNWPCASLKINTCCLHVLALFAYAILSKYTDPVIWIGVGIYVYNKVYLEGAYFCVSNNSDACLEVTPPLAASQLKS